MSDRHETTNGPALLGSAVSDPRGGANPSPAHQTTDWPVTQWPAAKLAEVLEDHAATARATGIAPRLQPWLLELVAARLREAGK
jgi:hypothetical protein